MCSAETRLRNNTDSSPSAVRQTDGTFGAPQDHAAEADAFEFAFDEPGASCTSTALASSLPCVCTMRSKLCTRNVTTPDASAPAFSLQRERDLFGQVPAIRQARDRVEVREQAHGFFGAMQAREVLQRHEHRVAVRCRPSPWISSASWCTQITRRTQSGCDDRN